MLRLRSAVAWWRPPMCMFTMPVEHVTSTRIFVRPDEDERQLVVYGMTVSMTEDGAMVLPIPVPPGTEEDAVRFIDLSACPGFFDELRSLFPAPAMMPQAAVMEGALGAPRSYLAVHDVGDYEASFVPSPSHFNRLDPRFRLPDAVWDAFPRYHEYGFCVFKLKTRRRPSGFLGLFRSRVPLETQRVHPMAFTFPRRDERVLFFPTVHVHDGQVHPTADFDHELFCQTDEEWEPLMEWERSQSRAGALRDRGSVASTWTNRKRFVFRKELRGELPNRDTTLAFAKLRARTEVKDLFRLRMCAAWEHLVDDGKTPLEPHVKKWMRVSEAERVRVREAMSTELGTVFDEKKEAWGLAPFAYDEPRFCCVKASNQRLEPQEVHVAFAADPPPDVLREVEAAVQAALDHATNDGSSFPPPSGPRSSS